MKKFSRSLVSDLSTLNSRLFLLKLMPLDFRQYRILLSYRGFPNSSFFLVHSSSFVKLVKPGTEYAEESLFRFRDIAEGRKLM